MQHAHLMPEVFAETKYKDGIKLPDPTPQKEVAA